MKGRNVIVVPCYNEARRLDPNAFAQAVEASADLQLLFVDDGSTDATAAVLEDLNERLGDRADVLTLTTNLGKAEAVRSGIMRTMDRDDRDHIASIGYWDADLATSLMNVDRFRAVLDSGDEALAVIGSRIRLMGREIERRPARHYAGRVFATLASAALGFPVYDTQCGAKLFRANSELREIFATPFRSAWAFDVEILARFAALHGRDLGARGLVVEYPLQRWIDVGASKVRLIDLPRMLLDIMRIHREYR